MRTKHIKPHASMSRREFLKRAGGATVAPLAACSISTISHPAIPNSTGVTDRPNILFIFTDQQSATMMSCAGNPHLRTPAMDALAAGGVRFDRAYCANPVCVPSRFSLVTGRMPSAIGMLSNDTSSIAKVPDAMKKNGLGWMLRKAGYDVAYGGKVHLPRMTAEDVGFDRICRDERERLAESCAEFIRRKRNKPFFLVASFINPHDICYMAICNFAETDQEHALISRGNVECAALDAALTRPAGIDEGVFFREHCPPLPPNYEPQADEPEAIRLMIARRPFRLKARSEWKDERWREHRWAYARLTERVDAQIGRVLDALQDSGQANRTLVVFTSDHGDMDAAHRLEHKSTLYEEACRIPLIFRPPGPETAGRVDQTHLVSNGLDLFPTFCDYAGIEPPPELSGRSLRPLVQKADREPWRKAVPVECAIGRAVITSRFKYAVYDIGGSREQLIDMEADPGEILNARHDPQHQHAVEAMKALYYDAFGSGQRHPAEVLKAAADA